MIRRIVVRINWPRMAAPQTVSFAHNVAAKMSPLTVKLSADAPSSPVTQGQLNDAADRLEMAYANRLNGPAAKTEFENAGEVLDVLLHQQAEWVNAVANGDKAIIEALGFAATSDTRKKAVIPATPNVPSITGNASALRLSIPGVQGADSYCWVISTNGAVVASVAETHISLPGAAIVLPDGTPRETLRGIVNVGATITVQVLAQNAAGKSGFTTPVNFTVGS